MSSEYPPPSGYGQQGANDQFGQQGQYGQPGYGQERPKNGLGLAGLILGIVGLLLSFFLIGLPLAIVGLVLSIIGLRRVGRRQATNKGVALAGVVVSILGVLAGAAVVAFTVWIGSQAAQCVQDAGGDQAQVQQCSDSLIDRFS